MNRSRFVWVVTISIGLLAAMPFSAERVAAHTHKVVEPYEFVVGWREEPPVVGVMNGLDLRVLINSTKDPVDRAHTGLTANLTKGSAWYSPSLLPASGENGSYTFDVMPTEPGIYSVRIHGTVGTTPVDFTVQMQEVDPAADVEFPTRNPTPGDLQGRIAALQGQVTLLLAVASLGVILAAASTAAAVMLGRRLRKAP